MTLATLLEELKEVDAKIYDDISHLELIGWQQPRNQVMDHLQGRIQRACERRGWLWTHSKEDSTSEEAIAGTPYNAIIFDDEINILVEDIYGASAAEALLAAYIAAAREEAKR